MEDDKKIAAEILVNRIGEKCFLKDPIELEVNGVFYWLLGRLHKEIDRSYYARDEYVIRVTKNVDYRASFILQDTYNGGDSRDTYFSRYIEKYDDFEVVIKKVVDIFDSMPKYKMVYRGSGLTLYVKK